MKSQRSPLLGVALGWAVRSIAALAGVLVLLVRPAGATIAVYASDDPLGAPQGEVELVRDDSNALDLWIYKGNTVSTSACDKDGIGTGDAICGYHVLINVEGSGYIENFAPDSGEVVSHPSVFTSNPTTLEASSIDVSPSSTPVPVRIGTLTVYAQGGEDSTTVVKLGGRNIVAANLALENIPGDTIASTPVPEPAEILLLASGIAGLAWLYRLRKGSLSAAIE